MPVPAPRSVLHAVLLGCLPLVAKGQTARVDASTQTTDDDDDGGGGAYGAMQGFAGDAKSTNHAHVSVGSNLYDGSDAAASSTADGQNGDPRALLLNSTYSEPGGGYGFGDDVDGNGGTTHGVAM